MPIPKSYCHPAMLIKPLCPEPLQIGPAGLLCPACLPCQALDMYRGFSFFLFFFFFFFFFFLCVVVNGHISLLPSPVIEPSMFY